MYNETFIKKFLIKLYEKSQQLLSPRNQETVSFQVFFVGIIHCCRAVARGGSRVYIVILWIKYLLYFIIVQNLPQWIRTDTKKKISS